MNQTGRTLEEVELKKNKVLEKNNFSHLSLKKLKILD